MVLFEDTMLAYNRKTYDYAGTDETAIAATSSATG